MALDSLPAELLLQIFAFLSVKDILSLRQTSKALCEVTRERSVWFDALYNHVVQKNVPVPGLRSVDVASLSSPELEQATIRALRCRENWTSDYPQPTNRIELHTTPHESGRYSRTYASYFLPDSNRYLMTFTRTDHLSNLREYIVQCWDLDQQGAPCIARCTSASLNGTQINSEPRHPVALTMTCGVPDRGIITSAYAIDFSARDPDRGFQIRQAFPSLGTTLKLEGSTFFATDESNRITAYNVETGERLYILRVPLIHNDQTVFLEEHRCLSMHIMGDFVLTFCQQWIHLYALPPTEALGPSPSGTVIELDPVAKHRWAYRIDTLKTLPMHAHPLAAHFRPATAAARARAHPPIYILLRFDSWFPWPVNILHLFVLPPNPAFRAASWTRPPPPPPSPSPPSLPATPTPTPSPAPARSLPYLASPAHALPPYAARSLPSPLRIFTPSDMALGRHGTALWLDAQTGLPAQAGDRGQRIAGARLRHQPPPPASPGTAALPRHAVNFGVGGGEAEEEEESKQMLFHIREDAEEWTRVAVCDEEARLAVSCVDGRVLVFDYT